MSKKDRPIDIDAIFVNLSTPFVMRTCCKFCGGPPETYYYIRDKSYCKDISDFLKKFNWIRKYHDRMCTDHYFCDDPSSFSSISHFSYPVNFNGYSPKLHMICGMKRTLSFIECITCKCGRTVWHFCYKTIKDRPEIINKKPLKSYPKKFVY